MTQWGSRHGEVNPASAGKKEDSATRLLRLGGDGVGKISGRQEKWAPGGDVLGGLYIRIYIYIYIDR